MLDKREVYKKLGDKLVLLCESLSYPGASFEWGYRKCEIDEWEECTSELPGAWVSKDLLEFYQSLRNLTSSSSQFSLTNTTTNTPIIPPNSLLKSKNGTRLVRSTNFTTSTSTNSTYQVVFL